jgi:hypothetical protein
MDLSRFMSLAERISREPSADPLLKEALNGLRSDWRDADPGKSGPNWFFVRSYLFDRPITIDRFWVDAIVDDLPAARLGREPVYRSPGAAERVAVPLGKLNEVGVVICDSHGPAWVIGKYEQTFDGPDGDVWQLDVYLLCPSCPKLHQLASRSEGHRFM